MAKMKVYSINLHQPIGEREIDEEIAKQALARGDCIKMEDVPNATNNNNRRIRESIGLSDKREGKKT